MRRGLLCGTSVLVLSLLAVLFLRMRQHDDTGGLKISNASLNLGHVWESPEYRWPISVANTTPEYMDSVRVSASCSCVSAFPSAFSLPAEGSTQVQLLLNLQKNGVNTQRLSWPFDVQVFAFSNGRDTKPTTWNVKGTVHQSPLEILPTHVDFGDSLVFGSEFHPKHLEVICRRKISSLSVSADESVVAVSLKPTGNDRYRVVIQPRSDLEFGDHDFLLLFQADVSQSDLPPSLARVCDYRLPCTANVVQGGYAVPASINFGVVKIGQTLTETVSVGHLLKSVEFSVAAKIEEVEADSPTDIEPDQNSGLSAQRKIFRISQRADKLGPNSSTATFIVSLPGHTAQTINVPISYHAIAAD